MTIFEATNYIEFLTHQIKYLDSSLKSRGGIKTLAERIGCHPTFISQVIHGKSHLNHDQALLCCKYFQLSEEETEFFIDLVNLERAGNLETKKYFQSLIERKQKDRKVFYKRAKLKNVLPESEEFLYLSHWTIPVIHAALQLPNCQNVEQLANLFGFKIELVQRALAILKKINLAIEKNGNWSITKESLHISKNSPAVNNFHMQWRLKTASKLMQTDRSFEDSHFSSLFAISAESAEQIRELLLRDLQEIRRNMVDSIKPTRLYVLALDFYPI